MRKATKSSPQAKRGRPVDMAKRQAMIHAAQEVFVNKGLEAASLEEVAAHAGVSKLTIYNHFGSKDELFVAALIEKCDSYMKPDAFRTRPAGSTCEGLIQIGRSFLGLIFDPAALKMHRVVMSESQTHPKIAALFFEKAIMGTAHKVVEFLAAEVRAARLSIDDVFQAATVYLALLKGIHHERALLNLPMASKADLNTHIVRCADLFLAIFAPREATAKRKKRRTR